MNLSFGSSNKFVLIIGDEGAVLLRVTGSRVRDRCFAPTSDPGDSAQMREMLSDSPSTPLYPLIDVLEQSFAKESIPPVSMFDAAGMLQRRLSTAFSEAKIKAAHYLGRQDGERRDRRYLLAGLPASPALDGWIDWINQAPNPVKPFSLLPLEAVSLARNLSNMFHRRGSRPQWVMLVTRHRTGGFRQVVIRGDEFVFTRLTQSLPEDASAGEVAATIEREYKLSMGYLRRMSYSDDQGLDIIVAGTPEIGQELLNLGMSPSHLRMVTTHDAAERLRLAGVADATDGYAEVLHGAVFAQKRRPVLSLLPEELYEKRAGALTTRAAYVFIALVVGYATFGLSEAYVESQEIDRTHRDIALMATEREAELEATANLAASFLVSAPEVADTVAIYDRLSTNAPSPMPFLALIGPTLGPDIVVHEVNWLVEEEAGLRDIRLAVTVHLDSTIGDMEDAVVMTDALAERMAAIMPGFEVRVTDPPVDILPNQNLIGEVVLDNMHGDSETGFAAIISIILPAVERGEAAS